MKWPENVWEASLLAAKIAAKAPGILPRIARAIGDEVGAWGFVYPAATGTGNQLRFVCRFRRLRVFEGYQLSFAVVVNGTAEEVNQGWTVLRHWAEGQMTLACWPIGDLETEVAIAKRNALRASLTPEAAALLDEFPKPLVYLHLWSRRRKSEKPTICLGRLDRLRLEALSDGLSYEDS